MNDLEAEKLRPLFEQLAGSIGPDSDAFFQIVQDSDGVQRIKANAAGFLSAGIYLVRLGLNSAGLPHDQPLSRDLQDLTIEKDDPGWLC
jgi:hypothetical protein